MTLQEGLATFVVGAVVVWLIYQLRKKRWYLETLAPRNHFLLGRERKLIVNMEVAGKTFNGFRAGGYTVILTHGAVSEHTKPVLVGNIEETFSMRLARDLDKRHLFFREERRKVLSFLFDQLPALKVKDMILTGEPVSPMKILDKWGDDKQDTVLKEMRKRKLIDKKVLWINPYPPEGKLKDILSGITMIPDVISEHEMEMERVTQSYRETLVEVNRGMAQFLKSIIPLARYVVSSISDPTFVFTLIMTARARQIEGLGIEQLAQQGGVEGVLEAGKRLKRMKSELDSVFGTELSKEEFARIQKLEKEYQIVAHALKELPNLKEKLEQLEKATTSISART